MVSHLFLWRMILKEKNRTNDKTKTIIWEVNVNSRTVLHVLGKSLVELHSRGEQLDLIRNFVTFLIFSLFRFIRAGSIKWESKKSFEETSPLQQCPSCRRKTHSSDTGACSKQLNRHDEFIFLIWSLFFLTLDMASDATGEAPNRTKNVPSRLPISFSYTIILWNPLQSRTGISMKTLISGHSCLVLRIRIWNSAKFSKPDFAWFLLTIVLSPTTKSKQQQQRLRAWFKTGPLGRLCQSNSWATLPWSYSFWRPTKSNTLR